MFQFIVKNGICYPIFCNMTCCFNATNIQAIDSNNDVVKYIQNGQLFIKRDGVVYDALGRVIK